eukprot:1803937-Prymnesium_polylepis.2
MPRAECSARAPPPPPPLPSSTPPIMRLRRAPTRESSCVCVSSWEERTDCFSAIAETSLCTS